MNLKENLKITKKPGDTSKVYCHEPYTQELYNLFNSIETYSKDLKDGDVLRVLDMNYIEKDDEVEIYCANYDTLYFSIDKEKKWIDMIGLSEEQFKNWIINGDSKKHFRENKTYARVENVANRKGSLYAAHLQTIISSFKEQILNPTMAYSAKVLSKNQGGFFVEIQGVKAFLPGSLAAANKIINFDEFIGKTINVMIEDYLQSSNIFVVSYKKYLDNILPSKLAELERNQELTGTVTGTSKYGVFIEVNELFTGLLHGTEMNESTAEKFTNGEFRPGMKIDIWLKDIKDNKLILTEKDPSIKMNEMEDYREKVEGNYKEATIISIKSHGALMEIEKGILGLLPVKEMKKTKKRLSVGELLNVFIKKVDTSTGKIYLTLTDEHITSEV